MSNTFEEINRYKLRSERMLMSENDYQDMYDWLYGNSIYNWIFYE